jgi:predicted acylesterase/phospholipase RssA
MKRRPQGEDQFAVQFRRSLDQNQSDLGIVLSGGGVRAAYQAGALKALSQVISKDLDHTSIILGSSIGAVNGLVISAGLKTSFNHSITLLEDLWRERTFSNTFSGTRARAFIRAIRIAAQQYLAPGPHGSKITLFDPEPLREQLDAALQANGGLTPEGRAASLKAVGVMTTLEGESRKPLLFLSSHQQIPPEQMHGTTFDVCYVNELTAKHGFASAALPSVLPPVEIDTERGKVRLVDGGISQNVPVDPAVRLGAHRIIIIDISGRSWWFDHYGEPHDTRPTWEVPAESDTFCLRPPQTLTIRPSSALGPLLKAAVGNSHKKFMNACGALWPLFTLVKAKLGEDLAYEVMSYGALDPDYLNALMEQGYHDTVALLRRRPRNQLFYEHEEEQDLTLPTEEKKDESVLRA